MGFTILLNERFLNFYISPMYMNKGKMLTIKSISVENNSLCYYSETILKKLYI